ncbi:hypothetical protein KDH83_20390, partial [Achromobacter sp. Marseille-Q0513]|uniref:hypothetical protein n=1 Tax=Achromobacter sp. Marseille-Q0513 TaxID=2829161 RepID=UPI001B9BC25D
GMGCSFVVVGAFRIVHSNELIKSLVQMNEKRGRRLRPAPGGGRERRAAAPGAHPAWGGSNPGEGGTSATGCNAASQDRMTQGIGLSPKNRKNPGPDDRNLMFSTDISAQFNETSLIKPKLDSVFV